MMSRHLSQIASCFPATQVTLCFQGFRVPAVRTRKRRTQGVSDNVAREDVDQTLAYVMHKLGRQPEIGDMVEVLEHDSKKTASRQRVMTIDFDTMSDSIRRLGLVREEAVHS